MLVAVPVFKDGRRFHLEKGRRWTVIEHAILEALAKSDWTIQDLTDGSALPRRVVIEVVIRLMRAGWVELRVSSGLVKFSTTAIGRLYASREELPPVTRVTTKYVGYVVDLISGSVFRARDLVTLTEEQWHARREGRLYAEAGSRLTVRQATPSLSVLAGRLLEADEQIIRVDTQDSKPRTLIGLVTVRDSEIEGLSGEVPEALKRGILSAARQSIGYRSKALPQTITRDLFESIPARVTHSIAFRSDDLILGGEEHRAVVQRAVERANHRIVIHSTFINEPQAALILDLLMPAVQRGAVVDILWGQSREKDQVNRTRQAAGAMKRQLTAEGLQDRIRVHMTTTRSHAKVILADMGDRSRFQAIIGSCNWLSSDFASFDVSVRLREASLVAELAWDLSEMVRPKDGQVPDLSVELWRLGCEVMKHGRNAGGRGTARIVTAPEHAAILADARDEAKENIIALSHRLDVAAKPALVALSAAKAGGVASVRAVYGRPGDHVTAAAIESLERRAAADGVKLTASSIKLHAKVLAWDADAILVTSLNILSADPGEADPRQELGVLIRAPEVVVRLSNALKLHGQSLKEHI